MEGEGVVDLSLVLLHGFPVHWIATRPYCEDIWRHGLRLRIRDDKPERGVGTVGRRPELNGLKTP
jgi:hypothetical protein